MLSGNSQILVQTLASLPLLDGRYSNIQLVNLPAGVKRGNFSLVFKAYDEQLQMDVALKFFDLDPAKQQAYRLMCFDREHQILRHLVNANRCLQLTGAISDFQLQIPMQSGGASFTVPVKYFATEWLPNDLDGYFITQHEEDALKKLLVFKETVLAVEALHSRRVFHRDLKPDNLRERINESSSSVVAIDLGTAAEFDSGQIVTFYSSPAGMRLYSSPEAFCGLAGNRDIGFLSDIYALGALLFEMFNADDFYTAYRSVNSDFDARLSALLARMFAGGAPKNELESWRLEAPRLLQGLMNLNAAQSGSTVPACVSDIINRLVSRMTAPDFRNRVDSLSWVRGQIDSCIACLRNDAYAQRRAKAIKAQRTEKRQRALERSALIESRRLAALGEGDP